LHKKHGTQINSKSQAPNSKQIPITKHSKPKQEKNRSGGPYPFSKFPIPVQVSDFEIRIFLPIPMVVFFTQESKATEVSSPTEASPPRRVIWKLFGI